MNRNKIEEFAFINEVELLFVDGHDNAIIGIVRKFNDYSVLYDKNIVIDNIKKDGCSQEEAEEFFEFNIIGAYLGENTPVFTEQVC